METRNEKQNFLRSFTISIVFVGILWIILIIQNLSELKFFELGILPRHLNGLTGILTAPLIHSNYPHLISNSPTLLILSTGILYFYPSAAPKAFTLIYLLSGGLIWIFARQAWHIGASGLLYGLLGFLFFSGIFRRDRRSIALALLVIFLYGGFVWGILPLSREISWEAHLFGGLSGILASFLFRKDDPYILYEWETGEENTRAVNDREINQL